MSKIFSSWKYSCYFSVFILILFVAGCGGGYGSTSTSPTPTLMLSSSTVTFPAISQGASSGPMSVTVTNNGTGSLTISSIVPGGTNPGDFTNSNTCSAPVAYLATCSISVTFTPTASGPRSETLTLTDNASGSPQVITVNGTANAIALTVTPPTSAMATGQTLPFMATGDPNGVTWSVAGFTSPSQVTGFPAGAIDASGNYTPPASSASFYAVVTATSKTDNTKSATATVNVVSPGAFTPTLNPQVAQYAVILPSSANVSVQFGLDTNYGLNTWSVPTSPTGALSTALYVAGMKQSTPYHMRGQIAFADGSSFNDADFTFTTQALPAGTVPNITTTTTAGMTPQPGVEVLDLLDLAPTNPPLLEVLVTDLNGNIIWAYNPGTSVPAGSSPQPIKLLANGHFLINLATANAVGEALSSVLQEVDLGSNVIWSMTSAQLNTALAAAPASCTECNVTILGMHHDFAILPNGHIVVLTDTTQVVSGTTVYGDVVIDLGDMENVSGTNPTHAPQPTWAWNEFNHFDINRRPYSYPDWTHTNAVIYSKDDGNLIISSRHQNWLVKMNYNNGAGNGDIIWKMGAVLPGDAGTNVADFTLKNADGSTDTTATDWFFAQHDPTFTTTSTAGTFGLTLFDNGDDRGAALTSGASCGSGEPIACFSTVPVFTIDETAKTATFVVHPTAEDYSFFGGSADVLANGNLEYDECSNGSLPPTQGTILEVTQSSTPQTVWKMVVSTQYSYRGIRMGSLYPGVQW